MSSRTSLLLLLAFSLSLLSLLSGYHVHGSSHHHHHRHHQHHHHHHHRHSHRELGVHLFGFKPQTLFVFGDSYADTGNNRKAVASSWKEPYGITFPGKPAGRFSDGRVLTDFFAKSLGIKSPIPFRLRKYVPMKTWESGMNFAFGGTGVFNTLVTDPNMTVQIDFFQKLIQEKVSTPPALQQSVALVSLVGNDYAAFLFRNGSSQDLQGFIVKVVKQLAENLQRIHRLGVRKVVVSGLQPLGCLPRSTAASGFQQCNGTENALVGFHNALLQQAVANFNNQTNDSPFIILDLFNSFMTVFKNKGERPGSSTFGNPLKPCCIGISSEDSCGTVDPRNGGKRYTVCDDPESAFFWDAAHPTQQGWRAVYSVLRASLLRS